MLQPPRRDLRPKHASVLHPTAPPAASARVPGIPGAALRSPRQGSARAPQQPSLMPHLQSSLVSNRRWKICYSLVTPHRGGLSFPSFNQVVQVLPVRAAPSTEQSGHSWGATLAMPPRGPAPAPQHPAFPQPRLGVRSRCKHSGSADLAAASDPSGIQPRAS